MANLQHGKQGKSNKEFYLYTDRPLLSGIKLEELDLQTMSGHESRETDSLCANGDGGRVLSREDYRWR